MLAPLLFAITLIAAATPSPAASPAMSGSAPAVTQPAPKALAPVVINGVLFRGVEFDAGKAVWRNLAVTVTPDRIDAWRALPAGVKNQYAQQMIDTYRTGMSYRSDIKLSFIDERNATLDQFIWTPPANPGR